MHPPSGIQLNGEVRRTCKRRKAQRSTGLPQRYPQDVDRTIHRPDSKLEIYTILKLRQISRLTFTFKYLQLLLKISIE